jgi:hypothetical protein
MGGMMGMAGPGGAWITLWIVLGAAVLVTSGVLAGRASQARRRPARRSNEKRSREERV